MSTKREQREQNETTSRMLPLMPVRELAVFPQMVASLLVNREQSHKALEQAQQQNAQLVLALEPEELSDEIKPDHLPAVGIQARILQIQAFPNGVTKVVVEGQQRVLIDEIVDTNKLWQVLAHPVTMRDSEAAPTEAARRTALEQFRRYITAQRFPEELYTTAESLVDPLRTADFLASQVQCPAFRKQPVIDARSGYEALITVSTLLITETDLTNLERDIEGQVRERINKSQRQYFLQEQLRQIKKELGETEDADDFGDVIQYRKLIKKAKMPKEVKKKAEEELERLKQMPMLSPEATVVRGYLDWLCVLPWATRTTDRSDIGEAHKILEEDHYGLLKPKERILEYLSVLKLVGKIRGPILCFVGPPGVGKTSLARSIARALDRKFVRVSLGGIRDEAEIRGHRRTYIGSLPGRIIQGMKKAGARNPVFLLDEIDKMAVDFRGDPASALLEVLDPEQNRSFSDHYLEVEFDLSEVLFITTANYRAAIPEPLLDRMELIELLGYLPPEKLQIAKRFLVPRQLTDHGMQDGKLTFADAAIKHIVDDYTREAGVRDLERSIASVCRKGAKRIAEGKTETITVTPKSLSTLLGVPKYVEKPLDGKARVGVAIGLAWTPVGGDVLKVQVALVPGKGKLVLTGSLGDVMKESGMAALTLLKMRHAELGIPWMPFEKNDLHVHVPEGAVPKDGPSAGITLATALYSALSGRKVRGDLAMTGEVTLQGEVLPIGGLPEKLMAAKRAGVSKVLIPEANRKDLKEVPKAVLHGLHLIPVKTIDQVWKIALKRPSAKDMKEDTRKYTSVVPTMEKSVYVDLDDLEIEDI